MSLALDLLEQAGFLARREPGKPKQASLRRSISSAYYAAFHHLGEECASLLIRPVAEKRSLRFLARRALVHGKMRSLCSEFAKPTPSSPLLKAFWVPLAVPSSGISLVSHDFQILQDLRHEADYDLSKNLSRAEALIACDFAIELITAWTEVRVRSPKVANRFATALSLWPSLSQR